MTKSNDTNGTDRPQDQGLPENLGNEMSSRSGWTDDMAPNDGVMPSSQPEVDAGTALGGAATRMADQADGGVPQGPGDQDNLSSTGTTFGADTADDKLL